MVGLKLTWSSFHVTKIVTGETEKTEVVDSTLKQFYDKFQSFRANMQRVDMFFAPKGLGQGDCGGGWCGGGGRGGGNEGGGRGGGYGEGRGGGVGGRVGGRVELSPYPSCIIY